MQHYPDVDTYIASYPAATQRLLEQMRATIRKAAPQAEEVISYGMPAYSLGTKLVYFGGHQQHIGFYPTASGIREFEQELSRYKFSKGAVQFPLDQPLPLALVTRIVKMRLQEVTAQQAMLAASKEQKARAKAAAKAGVGKSATAATSAKAGSGKATVTATPTKATAGKGAAMAKSTKARAGKGTAMATPVKASARKATAAATPTLSPFATLVAPAQRALMAHNIKTLKQLAKHSEAEILAFHGVGPSSMPPMRQLLADAGLHFKA